MDKELNFETKKPAPEDIISLWRECFPEDDFFFITDYVFERLTGAAALAVYNGDDIVSMVNIIPVRTFYGEDYLKTFFLSGICTHHEFRNLGLSSSLFEKVKSMAESKGADIIQISVPVKDRSPAGDFFSKRGFLPIAKQLFYPFSKNDIKSLPRSSDYQAFVKQTSDVANDEFAALAACYTRNKGDGCFGRSVQDFMVKVNEADQAVFIVKGGDLTGYCLVTEDCASDIFCDNEESLIALLNADVKIKGFVLCEGQADSFAGVLSHCKTPSDYSFNMAFPLSEKAGSFLSSPSVKFNPDNH